MFTSAKPGFYAPADCLGPVVVDAASYHYLAVSDDGSEHEEGTGAWNVSTGTLTRGNRRNSSNAGGAVTFLAPPTVYMGGPVATDMSGPRRLEITYTGTWLAQPLLFQSIPAFGIQPGADASLTAISGACLDGLHYDEGMKDGGIVDLSFDNLGGVLGEVRFSSLESLVSLEFPSLVATGDQFTISNCPNLTVLDLSSLVSVGSNADGDGFTLDALDLITSVDLSSLVNITGGFGWNSMFVLTEISFPALTNIGHNFAPNTMPLLTSIDLSALVTLQKNVVMNNATDALEAIIFTSALKHVGGDFSVTSCALTEATVDNILVRFAALDGTNGTTIYGGKSVTLTGTSAPPSATGLAAKVTLEDRTCTVTVNS